jgi:hypothetical protein
MRAFNQDGEFRMRSFDKLIKDCDAADAAADQKQRDRERLIGKATYCRAEIHACEGRSATLLKEAEKIIADAKIEAEKKTALAGEVKQNVIKLREKLAATERDLQAIDGVKTQRAIVPSVLGLR